MGAPGYRGGGAGQGVLLSLLRERGCAAQSIAAGPAVLSAFYVEMLGREEWTIFSTIKTKDIRKLPAVLTSDEVRWVLGGVREMRFRVCLRLIYECGLRLTEALRIETRDIGRDARRLHVRCGKSGKERYVPLSPLMIDELSDWWRQHRNKVWMFPSIGNDAKGAKRTTPEAEAAALGARMRLADKPMSESALQSVFGPAGTCAVKRCAPSGSHFTKSRKATRPGEFVTVVIRVSRRVGDGEPARGQPNEQDHAHKYG